MLGCVVLRGREAMEEGRGLSHADSRRTHCREGAGSLRGWGEVAREGQGQQEAGMAEIAEVRGDRDRKLCGPWISMRILVF